MTEKTTWTETELRAAHKSSSLPFEQVLRSDLCGCFYCERVFPTAELVENGDMAWCPHCGLDAVLPENEVPEIRNEAFRRRMRTFWF